MENHPEIIQPNQNIQPNLPPPEEDVVAQNQQYMFNSEEDSQDTMDILNQLGLDFDDEPELQPENQIVPYQPPPQPPFNQQPENQIDPLQPFNQQNQPGVEPEYIFNDSTKIFQYNQQQENLDELFSNQPPPQPENQNQIVANQLPPQPFNQQPENENEMVPNQAPPQPPFNQNQQNLFETNQQGQQTIEMVLMNLLDLINNNPPPSIGDIPPDADRFLVDLNNGPNPFQDYLHPPNPVVHKHKEVYKHEDGKWYTFARLGPFHHENEAKFARLHLPPDNLRDFTLSGGVLYEKVLVPNDLTRVSLPVTDDPSTTLPMSPIGLIHRVWDPYQHHWWDFTTGKLGSVSVLKGWQAYQRAHKLLAGDRIQFRSATNNLTHEVFYVLVQFRASPGSTSFELPYQNVS